MKGKHFLDAARKETFRRYLLGETAFPSDVRVILFVTNDDAPAKFITLPVENLEEPYRDNLFIIPGVEFRLLVGETFDRNIDSIFKRLSGNIAFDLREQSKTSRFDKLGEMVRNSPAKGKLRDR